MRAARVARQVELQARLLEEVRIARNVSHPNVCFDEWDWIATMSSRHAAASTLSLITQAVLLALVLLLLLSFAWMAARRERRTLIAFALFFALVGALWGYDTGRSAAAAFAGAVGAGVEAAVILFVIVRFGVLGMISFLAADLVLSNVVTLQSSAWYSGPSWLRLALIAMAAAFAYMQVIRVARPPAAARWRFVNALVTRSSLRRTRMLRFCACAHASLRWHWPARSRRRRRRRRETPRRPSIVIALRLRPCCS